MYSLGVPYCFVILISLIILNALALFQEYRADGSSTTFRNASWLISNFQYFLGNMFLAIDSSLIGKIFIESRNRNVRLLAVITNWNTFELESEIIVGIFNDPVFMCNLNSDFIII
jgi:hypothetical protein